MPLWISSLKLKSGTEENIFLRQKMTQILGLSLLALGITKSRF